ncbi:sensor histidine kinase [Maribacter forsetii]|uniref:sensor histidine kinase n=1 Tax=Maribacter forsetii TaxID=444515 RepID=UPI000569E230|nr:ATP-binding protein [Maribacter forsetii]
MKKLGFSIFLLSISITAQSDMNSRQSELSNFLIQLKNFNYHDSNIIAENFDYELQKEAVLLVDVLSEVEEYRFKLNINNNLKNPLALCLNKLAVGYNNLFIKPYDSQSYKFFNEVYVFAKENNFLELEKFALISILEVYSFELLQTNEEMLLYLERLNNIKNDNADEYHYKMNLLHFSLRDIFLDIKVDNIFFEKFDRLMSNFSISHKFWPNYLSSKAVYLETKKQYVKAEENYLKAIELINHEKFLRYIKFRSFIRLAEIKKKLIKPRLAIQYIDSASIYKNQTDSVRSNYYLNYYYSSAYAMLGNYKLGYNKFRKADSLKTFIDYERNAKEISALNVKYQTAEKEKQILEEKQKAQITRNWLIAATIALIFGAGIAILFQKNTTKKRKLAEQETLLKQERVDNLLKEQELVSIDAMIEGQEKERQRVANELHDDLGSLMATIKLHFSNVKGKDKDPALKQAQSLLEEAYQKVRGIAHSKNSGVMSSQGLLPAVKKMAQVISETNALEVSVEDFGMGERMENSLELSLFRTIQELVANTIKHAEATKLNIQISQYDDNLNIIIEDNGKGFDRTKLDKSKTGMGLTNIEKRIEHLEGNFTIDSVLGKGTSIIIDIPV